MHISSGRWMYGLLLALITSVLWGILPIKLKEVLQVMDPVTVTWYRLAVAGSLLFAYLAASRRLPRFRPLGRKGGWLLALAIGGLTANYVLYLVGLNLLSPGTTQLVIQVAPILLLISSLFVFRERFSLGQAIGLMVMLLGFGLFFNQRLGELLTSLTAYTTGVLTVLAIYQLLEDPPWERKWAKGKLKIDYIGISLITLGLGCLQVMLDRGEDEDWFASHFIVLFAILALVGIVGAVYWLMYARKPVVDILVMKDRNFWVAGLLMAGMAMILYGSSVVLPQLGEPSRSLRKSRKQVMRDASAVLR